MKKIYLLAALAMAVSLCVMPVYADVASHGLIAGLVLVPVLAIGVVILGLGILIQESRKKRKERRERDEQDEDRK